MEEFLQTSIPPLLFMEFSRLTKGGRRVNEEQTGKLKKAEIRDRLGSDKI